jgi:hypothetical protein
LRTIDVASRATRSIRPLHEFLVAMNIAWAFEWYDRQKGHPGIFPWVEFSPFLRRLYGYLRIDEPGPVLEQVIWSLLLGSSIFILLRLIARFSFTSLFLRSVGGGVALTGFPVFYLTLNITSFYGLGGGTRWPWNWLEILIVLICGTLFYFRKLPFANWFSVLLLVLHFAFWAKASGNYITATFLKTHRFWSSAFWIVALFYCGFPLIVFLSSLVWGSYVRVSERAQLASSPAAAN